MMTRNKGQKKSIVSELGLVSSRNSKVNGTVSSEKGKSKGSKQLKKGSLDFPDLSKSPNDEEDCETSIDELIPNPTNYLDEQSSSPFISINDKEVDDKTSPVKADLEKTPKALSKNDTKQDPDENQEDEEENECLDQANKSISKERFTCNDSILKGILEYVSDAGTLPTPTKRSTTPKPDRRVTCQSRIASIVDSLWNEVNINAELDEKDDLLASANLVRPGIFEILKKRREIENKKQSRSVTGRLRPNPKQKKYSDMVDEELQNQDANGKSKKFFSKKKMRSSKNEASNNIENGNEMSDTQDGNSNASDNSSDTNDQSKEPSRKRTRRTDMKQHIEWKFCYENKANSEQNDMDKKPKSNRNTRIKENYFSGDEEYPSPSRGYNRSFVQRSPPPMRAAPSLSMKNGKTKRRNTTGYGKKSINSDEENFLMETNAYKEKVKKIWGFKYSRYHDHCESSDSEVEDTKLQKSSKRSVMKICSKLASRSKKDKFMGLSMFEKLILGLRCTVLIGNLEAYIKELDMRDYQTISKRIEKTNFILRSVSIGRNNGKENLYNIILTHAKVKPGLPPNQIKNEDTNNGPKASKTRGKNTQKGLLAKSDFKCKSDDEYKPKSSFYCTAEIEKLKERTYSDSAIYDENQKKVRAFTNRLLRRTNLDRHRKFISRHIIRKKSHQIKSQVYREQSPDTEPETDNSRERFFHQSLYDKKRKFNDSKRQTNVNSAKQARLSPNSVYNGQESYDPSSSYNETQTAKINIPSSHEAASLAGLPVAANRPPGRKPSPKKLIRKVYTGTSTVPKILNRKRTAAMTSMGNINKAQQSSTASSASTVSQVKASTENNSSTPTITSSLVAEAPSYQSNSSIVTATKESDKLNAQQSEALTNGDNDYSDSMSDLSNYSQPLVRNVKEKNNNFSSMEYNSSSLVTVSTTNINNPKNDLIYESASPAGSMTSSNEVTGVYNELNPSVSLSASQLLRMKKVQPPTSTPMDIMTTTMQSSNVNSNIPINDTCMTTSSLSMTSASSNQKNNQRVLLPRPLENGHEQKMRISMYQEETLSRSFTNEDDYHMWNNNIGHSSTNNTRTQVGYNQTKVILSNPANNFYLKTVNPANNSSLYHPYQTNGAMKSISSINRPTLSSSKSASNLNLPPVENQSNMPLKYKNVSIKSDFIPSTPMSTQNITQIHNQHQQQQQRNLVHKVHSFRKILPKNPSQENLKNEAQINPHPHNASSNPANQAKVLKSLLESNQPQKGLQNSASLKVNNPSQQQTGIIGKIGPNGQIINQHNQNSQFNSHQSRGTWKFTQKAHILSATRTKNGPTVDTKPDVVSDLSQGKQTFENESDPVEDTNNVPVNAPIKVVRLISENRPIVGQVHRLMGD